jgi:hypothetical protein
MSNRVSGRYAAALFLAIGLTLMPGAASANANFDGTVDANDGYFARGAQCCTIYALVVQDTVSDGHCVYWNILTDGILRPDLKSCGAYLTREYADWEMTNISTKRCITGHWVCSGSLTVFL